MIKAEIRRTDNGDILAGNAQLAHAPRIGDDLVFSSHPDTNVYRVDKVQWQAYSHPSFAVRLFVTVNP